MFYFSVVVNTTTPMLMRLDSELIGGLRKAWEAIGREAVRAIHTNFQVGGRPSWVPLSAERVRRKGHSRPLIDTGRLMNSTYYRYIGGGLELYNDTPYGELHQNGGDNAQGKYVPARPWMTLRPEDEVNFVRILDSVIQDLGR
jgi:phage gpG-like protein